MNNNKEQNRIVALIAKYGHLDRILTIAGIVAVAVLATLVVIVLVMSNKDDALPTNVVFDDEGHITAVLGEITVCLDPGHGYDDPGTDSDYLGDDYAEREITLDIGLRVREILKGYGIGVVMTRDTNTPDEYIAPNENGQVVIDPVWRADYANSQEIDLFVSIHCDSYTADNSISGARVYYMTKGDDDKNTTKLAKKIALMFRKSVGGDEVAMKPMNSDSAYYVVKNVNVPSLLIETGFVTNESDAKNMLDEGWRQRAAEGIANGIIEYIVY